jgi:ribosomal protein S5
MFYCLVHCERQERRTDINRMAMTEEMIEKGRILNFNVALVVGFLAQA